MFNKERVSHGLIFPNFCNFQCYPQDMSLLSFFKIILQQVHLKHYQFYSILFISTNNCHCESDWRLVIGIYFLTQELSLGQWCRTWIHSKINMFCFNWQVYHMLPCPYVGKHRPWREEIQSLLGEIEDLAGLNLPVGWEWKRPSRWRGQPNVA